jgi:hypothetical protein
VGVFENIFAAAIMQLIVNETHKYAQQELSKSACHLTLPSRIRR